MKTIEDLRDIMAKINRQDFKSELQYLKESYKYAPPYKAGRVEGKEIYGKYPYPKQLSGLEDANRQKIRIAGGTSGDGQGITPYPGMPTGSTYLS